MTVSSTVRTAGPYIGTGAVSTYAFAFKVFATSDVLVQVTDTVDVLSTLTYGADYTVTLNGDQNANPGGNVLLAAPLALDFSLVIGSAVPQTQPTRITNAGGFLPQVIEDALDRIVILLQQSIGAISGVLRVPEIGGVHVLPPAVERADRVAGFDSEGGVTTYPRFAGTGGGDAALTTFIQAGTGAVGRTVEAKLREHKTFADYSSVAVAIAAAVANDYIIDVTDDVTVRIPTDAATLQICADRLTPINKQATITLNIVSGHALTTGMSIASRDCGQFRITSADAVVNLAAGFTGNVFTGLNGATMPRLACLINAANQVSGNGYSLQHKCDAFVEAGCGIKNTSGNGFGASYGCNFAINGSVFTGCSRNAAGAGITCWASSGSAETADVSGSLYYGAQAAHGGRLGFRAGKANNCFRHGIRATDAAVVDADAAEADDCSADTLGYSVYAYEAGVVNFVGGKASRNLGTAALHAYGAGSAINAENATVEDADSVNVMARRGGVVNVVLASVSGAGDLDFACYSKSTIVNDDTPTYGAPVGQQTCVIASGDIKFIPDPSTITRIRLDTEGGAGTDNLDTITPADDLEIQEGHIVILATGNNSHDVTCRDFDTSAAGGNYSLRTEFTAAQPTGLKTLLDASQSIGFMWHGSFWQQLFYSAN